MTTGASTRLPAKFGGSTRRPSRPAPEAPAGPPAPQAAGTQAGGTQAGGTQAGGPAEDQPEDQHDKHEERDAAATQESPEEASEMVTGQVIKDGKQAADVAAQLAERTADLQRLQAEYANYRKRVDRDRAAVREQAIVNDADRAAPGARRHRPGARAR